MVNMNEIYSVFNAETDFEKGIISELAYLVYEGNASSSGFTGDNKQDIRKALFGSLSGTLEEKVLDVTGYWSNDLEYIYREHKNLSLDGRTTIFQNLFDLLDGKELIEGVCFHK